MRRVSLLPWLALLLPATTTTAMFRFDCFNNLVVDRVDPITNFGEASMHLHMVSGGNGFSMTADAHALRNSTCTSCPIAADLSAYWVPTLYAKFKNGTGFGLVRSGQIVYYQPRGAKDEKVIAFPPGLKMLAGNPGLRAGSDDITQRAVTWVCLDYKKGNPVPEQQGIPNVKCPNGLRGQVNFPMCWNGKDLDSPDHQSHVAYAEGLDGGKCPPGFKKMIKLFYEAFYHVEEWDAEWDGDQHPFVLSNGDATGFGFHGDFFNGWDEHVLQAAIDQCADKNYFNAGECPPLRATFSDKPPAERCTRQPQVKEEIRVVARLPGGDVAGDDDDDTPAATTATPAATTVTPAATTRPAATATAEPAADSTAKPVATDKPAATTKAPSPVAPDATSKCRAKLD